MTEVSVCNSKGQSYIGKYLDRAEELGVPITGNGGRIISISLFL